MANIIYGMFNVAKTALITQQKALDITANNIANVNTEGYSRQRLNMEQNEPVRYEGGTLSTGVRANRTIQRIYDRFLNSQLADAAAKKGRWQAQRETLEKAELMFDEVSGYGLNNAMSQFWDAWQQLSNNPSGYTERVTLIGESRNMTDGFNKLIRDLHQVQKGSDISVNGAVGDINTLTGEIAELNLKISEIEAGNNHSANEFRDQRDLKLKELSSLINVNSFEDADGYLTIVTANGHTLVDRVSSWNLTTGLNATGFNDVFWESSSGALQNITSDISDGKLKGWIEARDTSIPDYLVRLNDMAQTMITAVNTLHSTGLTLEAPPDDTGIDFFSGTDASDIAVNTAVVNNSNLVAAALNTEGVPGGNGNAIAISELQNSLSMSGGTAAFGDFYNSLVSDVGRNVSQAKVNSDHQSMVSLQLATYREEVSGVSMDEEMVNMVQFQSAYNAAAKLVNTVDEMLEALIAMV
ncbi:MAG: flagellar hook-associated protein FlgK [Desulfosarcina sp.]|nr:flagellar hook-associated protein FlgK [Desulfosarcina sp.]MBC2742063.1 flagellar hook-associated protein FlgK [Desulfosarcina sp.]MBC2764976.1 flagellar hook-associated protein FlgK [Desulfosarcina sp.]